MFYKKAAHSEWKEMNLTATYADKETSTKILFRSDMSRGLDVTYDAGAYGGDKDFSVYTRLVDDNGIDFDIQCLPDQESEDLIIPVGINFTTGGVVTFKANVLSLPAGYKAILEDRLNGSFTELSQPGASYDAILDANTSGTGRFFLHTGASADQVDLNKAKHINAYAFDREIIIDGNPGPDALAELFTITGVKVGVFKLQPSDLNRWNVNVETGMYILKVSGNKISETKRIFIK